MRESSAEKRLSPGTPAEGGTVGETASRNVAVEDMMIDGGAAWECAA